MAGLLDRPCLRSRRYRLRCRPYALAFLSAAHRLFVAAMIRARPSGLKWRFFALGGVAAASASAFRTAAHRFFCAAAMRLRAAGLTERIVAPASASGAEAG